LFLKLLKDYFKLLIKTAFFLWIIWEFGSTWIKFAKYQNRSKVIFPFFSVDQSHAGGVLNKYRNIKNIAKNIFVVLCGRMTPEQKKIVQRQVHLLLYL
jgi:hypothetical protein